MAHQAAVKRSQGLPNPMEAHLGSALMLRDEADGSIQNVRLVKEGESNPAHGLLSVQSPLGARLLGRQEGERITVATPMGSRVFEIIDVGMLQPVP